jgi:hypothetical protein
VTRMGFALEKHEAVAHPLCLIGSARASHVVTSPLRMIVLVLVRVASPCPSLSHHACLSRLGAQHESLCDGNSVLVR